MAKVLVNDATLTDIADAIRTKDGSTAQMYPSEMAEKINQIKTAPEKATVTIKNTDDLRLYVIFKDSSEILMKNETKTIEMAVGESFSVVVSLISYNIATPTYTSSFFTSTTIEKASVVTLIKGSNSNLTVNIKYK